MRVMNVSRGEYDFIMRLAGDCSRNPLCFDEAMWVAEMRLHFGCEPHHEYTLKVWPYTPDQLTISRFS